MLAFSVRPPLSYQEQGRPNSELIDIYMKECKKGSTLKKVSDGVYVSLVEVSLGDYMQARQAYCSSYHKAPCIKCSKMLHVADLVVTEGYVSLPHAFSIVSPEVKYTGEKARRKLLQMQSSLWQIVYHLT